MSRRSRRSQGRNLNHSSDSLSQSMMSQSSNQTISPSSNDEDYLQHIVYAVKFILNHMASKFPIKRADLVKGCCNGSGKIFTTIMPAVQGRLKSIYGIIFHEFASIKRSNKQYICFADSTTASLTKLKKCDSRQQTLLLIILSYIFIKGTSVGEGVLLNFLESLDIHIDREHDYFGDVKKWMETFRKQLYLNREKKESEGSNEQKITIEWGERASMEFDKKAKLINVAEQHMELMAEAELKAV